jgi:hypothetical protein
MKFDASTSRKNGIGGFTWITMGIMVKIFFNNLKAYVASSSHLIFSLCVSYVKGATTLNSLW